MANDQQVRQPGPRNIAGVRSRLRRWTVLRYTRFAGWVKARSPALFRVGQFIIWSLRAARRRPYAAMALLLAVAALAAAPAYPPLWPYRDVFWIVAAALGLLSVAAASAAAANEALRRLLALLNGQRADLEARTRAVQQATDRRAAALEAGLGEIAGRTAALEAGLGKIAGQMVEAVGDAAARNEEKLAEVRADLAALEANVGDRIGELNQRQGDKLDHLRHEAALAMQKAIDARHVAQKAASAHEIVTAGLRQPTAIGDKEIHQELGVYDQFIRRGNYLNSALFQHFSRQLRSEDLERLKTYWLPTLGLELDQRALGYLAHRICVTEDCCSGRLATNIQDALLRVLVARSIRGDRLNVLEIGTLFGVGLAILYETSRGDRKKIHVTAIDPLEGYYDKGKFDPSTWMPVTSSLFEHNMRRMDIPQDDVTLIQAVSTDQKARRQAAKRRYNLLIIDGDHCYEGVKYDFDHYHSLVQRGGCIIFDDFDSAEWPDVKAFVKEEVRLRTDMELVGADWRTIVFRVIGKPKVSSDSPSN